MTHDPTEYQNEKLYLDVQIRDELMRQGMDPLWYHWPVDGGKLGMELLEHTVTIFCSSDNSISVETKFPHDWLSGNARDRHLKPALERLVTNLKGKVLAAGRRP